MAHERNGEHISYKLHTESDGDEEGPRGVNGPVRPDGTGAPPDDRVPDHELHRGYGVSENVQVGPKATFRTSMGEGLTFVTVAMVTIHDCLKTTSWNVASSSRPSWDPGGEKSPSAARVALLLVLDWFHTRAAMYVAVEMYKRRVLSKGTLTFVLRDPWRLHRGGVSYGSLLWALMELEYLTGGSRPK